MVVPKDVKLRPDRAWRNRPRPSLTASRVFPTNRWRNGRGQDALACHDAVVERPRLLIQPVLDGVGEFCPEVREHLTQPLDDGHGLFPGPPNEFGVPRVG
eukprot:scaffold18583_cov160-Amphora_coffeaeformis.AAC.9